MFLDRVVARIPEYTYEPPPALATRGTAVWSRREAARDWVRRRLSRTPVLDPRITEQASEFGAPWAIDSDAAPRVHAEAALMALACRASDYTNTQQLFENDPSMESAPSLSDKEGQEVLERIFSVRIFCRSV